MSQHPLPAPGKFDALRAAGAASLNLMNPSLNTQDVPMDSMPHRYTANRVIKHRTPGRPVDNLHWPFGFRGEHYAMKIITTCVMPMSLFGENGDAFDAFFNVKDGCAVCSLFNALITLEVRMDVIYDILKRSNILETRTMQDVQTAFPANIIGCDYHTAYSVEFFIKNPGVYTAQIIAYPDHTTHAIMIDSVRVLIFDNEEKFALHLCQTSIRYIVSKFKDLDHPEKKYEFIRFFNVYQIVR